MYDQPRSPLPMALLSPENISFQRAFARLEIVFNK